MDVLQIWIETARAWDLTTWTLISLGVLVIFQWMAFQALVVHYVMFRKKILARKPDRVRIALLERTLSFQQEQVDRIFDKLSSLRTDLSKPGRSERYDNSNSDGVENSFVTLGEVHLKRRMQELEKSKAQ